MRSLYSDVEGITDFDHLLNGVGLDGVVVAAPVRHHYPLAKASLLAGKHTLIEKPMASSSAESEELIETAERRAELGVKGRNAPGF
jgi:predicted dehydrogenase